MFLFILLFLEWLVANGRDPNFEQLPVHDMDEMLRKYYADVRTKSGQLYSKSAYVNLRASVNRLLTSPPFNRPVNIMQDRHFQSANNVFWGVIKRLRREGKDTSEHKSPLTAVDMAKIYSTGTVSLTDPVTLQRKVFLEIGLHFARRGREGLRDLRQNSFVVCNDTNGTEYVKMAYVEKEKNHQGTDAKEKKKNAIMLAQPNDPNCPVRSFKLYCSKLNKECESFYQMPNQRWLSDKDAWYLPKPAGIGALGNMMKNISKEAKLSSVYTNHALRVTAATALNHAGFEVADIAQVTGHSSTESLKSYINRPSQEKCNALSNALHLYGKENAPISKARSVMPILNDVGLHVSPVVNSQNHSNHQSSPLPLVSLQQTNQQI